MKSIIIFGGSGYVGKNFIRSFVKKGYKIIIPYQRQIDEADLRLLGSVGQIIPFHFTTLENPRILSILMNADICINLKTTWDSKESYLKKSIYTFNKELIDIIKKSSKIKKFIFFSGLGTEKRSTLRNEIISKTEELITQELKNSIIIRPSIILGNGDQFLSGLLPIFKISFFIPLFGDGSKKFQPVLIKDIVDFVSNLIEVSNLDERLFQLGGPDIFTYREFYSIIANIMNKKRVFVPIPMPIIRPVIGIAEKTPFSPINLEQLSLFDSDNILNNNFPSFKYTNMKPKKIISAIEKSL